MQESDIKHHIKNFSELLDEINSIGDKRKQLWREIYENAITDRQTAFGNFSVLLNICKEQSSEHAIHGRTLATYLERMSKANDQLIKLATLVEAAREKSDAVSSDDIYDQIKRNNK